MASGNSSKRWRRRLDGSGVRSTMVAGVKLSGVGGFYRREEPAGAAALARAEADDGVQQRPGVNTAAAAQARARARVGAGARVGLSTRLSGDGGGTVGGARVETTRQQGRAAASKRRSAAVLLVCASSESEHD